MEPERKIEKWLRAYAKKRRGQAGGPFELPPATRRLLHGQLARNCRESGENQSPSLREMLRRQWMVLLALAACVIVVASICLPVLDWGKKNVGAANTRQAATVRPGTSGVARNGILASPPPAGLSSQAGSPRAPVPEAGVATAIPAQGVGGGLALSGPQTTETFSMARELAAGLHNVFKNAVAPFQSLPVLSRFQVEQSGHAIRIVDQDGSIYEGWLYPCRVTDGTPAKSVPPNQAEKNGAGPALSLRTAGPMSAAEPSQKTPLGGPLESYYFRVKGENRTLNEAVVFSGRVNGGLPAAKDLPQALDTNADLFYDLLTVDEPKPGATNQWPQLPWPQLRISGTALVSGTNRVEVNAVPIPAAEETK